MFRNNGNLTSKLTRKLALWRNVQSVEMNELGQFPIVETHIKTIWGGIVPQTGQLLSGRAADTSLSRTTHKIIVRYDPSILPSDWFIYGGSRYEILYILDPYLNHERLEIFCEVVM